MIRRLRYIAIPVGIVSGFALVRSPVAYATDKSSKDAAINPPRTPWDVYCEPTAEKPPRQVEMENGVEKAVKNMRAELSPIKERVMQFYATAKAHTEHTSGIVMDQVKYLQTEATEEIKVGTIAGAFVLGYILSMRRRFLKKFFNGTVLAAATAAVIFPKESKSVAKNGYVLARSAALNAYSQATGGR